MQQKAANTIAAFYRAHSTAALAERYVRAGFTEAELAQRDRESMQAMVREGPEGEACKALCLRVEYLCSKRTRGPMRHGEMKITSMKLTVTPLLVYHAEAFAPETMAHARAFVAAAVEFQAALQSWVGGLLQRRTDVRERFRRLKTAFSFFHAWNFFWNHVKTGRLLLAVTAGLENAERMFRLGETQGNMLQVYGRQRDHMMQKLRERCGNDIMERFHRMLVRRITHPAPLAHYGELVLPPVNTQSAERLATELLVNRDFTFDDSCLHIRKGDPPELHQHTSADDAKWMRMLTPGETTKTVMKGILHDIICCICRFNRKAGTSGPAMPILPAADELQPEHVNRLADCVAHVCSPRRKVQMRREWNALPQAIIPRLRFLFERCHLVYVDENNEKIRRMSPHMDLHAPPVLRAAFAERLARGRTTTAKTRAWIATAADRPELGDALARGCRTAIGSVIASAFAALLSPDAAAALPETLEPHHARHVELMRHEIRQLALGGAALALLHARSSYDEFYHDVSPAAARVTASRSREELQREAGVDAGASLARSTVYVSRGTSWLSVCDFGPFVADRGAIPSEGDRLEMQRRLTWIVQKIMLGEPEELIEWDHATIELSQRIFGLAKCLRDVARASCMVHWDLYASFACPSA